MMAEYTIQVRTILTSLLGMTDKGGMNNADKIISDSWNKVFTVPFPIWNENYRATLCEKILKHYYMREICCETIGLWLFYLNRELQEIMPYYNELYKTISDDFEHLMENTNLKRNNSNDKSGYSEDDKTGKSISTNYQTDKNSNSNTDNSTTTTVSDVTLVESNTDTVKGKQTNSHSDTSNGNGKGVKKYSDTPQGTIANVETGSYLTNVTIDESTAANTNTASDENNTDTTTTGQKNSNTGSNDTSKTTNNSINTSVGVNSAQSTTDNVDNSKSIYGDIEHAIELVKGKAGGSSYVEQLMKIRDYLINIDMMIIHELEDCFMGIY